MKGSSAVQAAARRILAGDESVRAANLLESAILLDHGDDADLEELVYVLSVYSPEGGREYSGAQEVRAAITAALLVDDTESR